MYELKQPKHAMPRNVPAGSGLAQPAFSAANCSTPRMRAVFHVVLKYGKS
jgi:hypothetical protein